MRLATSGCGPLPRSLALPSKPFAAACQSLVDRPKSLSVFFVLSADSRQYLPKIAVSKHDILLWVQGHARGKEIDVERHALLCHDWFSESESIGG
jgi:hypothetical protein